MNFIAFNGNTFETRVYDSLVEVIRNSTTNVQMIDVRTANPKYWEWLNSGSRQSSNGWRKEMFECP